jgi:hypothetical protein
VCAALSRLLTEDSFRSSAEAVGREITTMHAPDVVAARLHANYA